MSAPDDQQSSIVVDHEHDHDEPSGSVTPPIHHRSMLQPVSPLAPLEYLQNQRRGSITDPSLHAHTHTPPSSARDPSMSQLTPPGTGKDDSGSNIRTKSLPLVSKPDTPYVFGNATASAGPSATTAVNTTSSPHPPTDKNLRRLLHSPTDPSQPPPFRSFSDSQKAPEFMRAMSGPPEQRMHDAAPNESSLTRRRSNEMQAKDAPNKTVFPGGESNAPPESYPPGFDWGMRRHSIAVGGSNGMLNRTSSLGMKRKLSFERMHNSSPLNEEMGEFTQSPDVEAPALKSRRSSAFTTRGIAELSIHDRREGTHQSSQQPWDRRDSIASTLSHTSSGFSDSMPRSLQTFAWTDNSPPNPGSNPAPPGTERFQHEGDTHMAEMSEVNGRRMSVPDLTLPLTGPDRPRRIRPRPNSRGSLNDTRHINTQPPPPLPHGGKIPSNGNMNDSSPPHSASSSTGSTLGPPSLPTREGISPYSRSPELRVSHKLAERKRRKEMKELFDELRDQLPADRSMKASKWEILSKAVDYINYLSTNLQESQRQVEALRTELDKGRNLNPHYPSLSNPPIVHSQGPSIVTGYGLPPGDPGSGPHSASSTTSRSTSVHPYPTMNGTGRSPPM